MTGGQRLETVPRLSDQPVQLLIVSDNAAELLDDLRCHTVAANEWAISTYQTVAEALAHYGSEEPDLFILQLSTGAPSELTLLDRIKTLWPRTLFVLLPVWPALKAPGLNGAGAHSGVLDVFGEKALCGDTGEGFLLGLGRLAGLPLPSLLQMMNWDKRSASILVHSATAWGSLCLQLGEVTKAHVHGTEKSGEEAERDILSWEETSQFLHCVCRDQYHAATWLLDNILVRFLQRKRERTGFGELDVTMLLLDHEISDRDLTNEPEDQGRSLDRQNVVPQVTPPDFNDKIKVNSTGNVKSIVDSALGTIDGAVAVALVDYSSGMALGMAGTGIDLEVASAGNTEVVRAKLQTLEALELQDSIEDILITLDTQYHIIYLIPGKSVFLYLVLSKERSNLAMARYKLRSLAAELEI